MKQAGGGALGVSWPARRAAARQRLGRRGRPAAGARTWRSTPRRSPVADLSLVMPITAASYPLGALLARFFLHEEVNLARWVGTAVIAVGVAVVAWGEADGRSPLTTARRPARAADPGRVRPRPAASPATAGGDDLRLEQVEQVADGDDLAPAPRRPGGCGTGARPASPGRRRRRSRARALRGCSTSSSNEGIGSPRSSSR